MSELTQITVIQQPEVVRIEVLGAPVVTLIEVYGAGGNGGNLTLEQARSNGNQIQGDIDANNNTIKNLKPAEDNQDAVNLQQMNDAALGAREYAEGLSDNLTLETLRQREPSFAGEVSFQDVVYCEKPLSMTGNLIHKVLDGESIDDAATVNQVNKCRNEAINYTDEVIGNESLEVTRARNNVIEGDINFNNNTGTNVRNGASDQEIATVAQMNAALSEAKTYAEALATNAVRILGDYDLAGTGLYPFGIGSGASGAVRRNDAWRISAAGTFHGVVYSVGDILYATQATPGQLDANWSSFDYNTQQATESAAGVMKIATGAVVANENSLNDTDAVTTKKLWLSFWPRVLAIAHTFAAKITFTTSPRLNSVTAGQYLKVDGSKDLTSVGSIPATDITDDAAHRFISDTQLGQLSTNTTNIATNSGDIANKVSKTVGATYTGAITHVLTQAEYDAIVTKSTTTIYFIV
jgi:hypothetical protein